MDSLLPPFSKYSFNKANAVSCCPRCKTELHTRVPRGRLVKSLFFWMSLKRYRCDKCLKYVYVKADRSK